ncbi:MAG: hypothetical protein QXL94_08300 [Candidatus Parvarchaeum sp.]
MLETSNKRIEIQMYLLDFYGDPPEKLESEELAKKYFIKAGYEVVKCNSEREHILKLLKYLVPTETLYEIHNIKGIPDFLCVKRDSNKKVLDYFFAEVKSFNTNQHQTPVTQIGYSQFEWLIAATFFKIPIALVLIKFAPNSCPIKTKTFTKINHTNKKY